MWALVLAGGIMLAPVTDITNCSKPEYRQTHLALCNQTPAPGTTTGGGGGRRGLLGLGGLGGIL